MKPVNRCIYCEKCPANGADHFLPRALGRFKNFEQLKNRICIKCNEDFSVLEGQFCGPSPEGMFRQMLGIQGRPKHAKHKKKKSLFHGRHYGTKAIEILGRPNPKANPILWELIPGQNKIHELRHIIFTDKQGRSHYIPIGNAMKPEELKKIIREKGLTGIDTCEFYASEEDQGSVEKLLTGSFPKAKIEWRGKGESGKKINVTTQCEVTDRYFRAIAKIGFHYFLKQFPNFTGSEPVFNGIRNFIQNGGSWQPFVKSSDEQLIQEFKSGQRLVNYGHILIAEYASTGIVVKTQFFVGPDHLPLVWQIRLSEKKSPIIFSEGKGHLFLYYEPSKRTKYDGLMDEIMVVRLSGLIKLQWNNL